MNRKTPYKKLKRLFDIFFSFIGLVLCLPIFIVIPILIKVDSKGPVFFGQMRIGRDFNHFRLYKFRTMAEDASKNGPYVTAGDDPRITKIGKFLRRTKIDELPQLWNVLKGDMSFVGPRPLVEEQVLCFQKDYKEIFKIRPGITDYATIAFRNEEEILRKCNSNDVERIYIEQILPQKIELCKKYLKEMGFLTDIKIILKTLLVIIRY